MRPLLVALAATVCYPAAALAADCIPARGPSGQSLLVPPALLDAGDVYHVSTGQDAQIVVTSDAPLQRVVLRSTRVVGYIATPFEPDKADASITAMALRIPAASLESGVAEIDAAVRGATMLNVAEYPELTFALARVSDPRLTSAAGEPKVWSMTLSGSLTIKGKSIELSAPATLALLPFTWRTMARYPGELLTLRSTFELKLADLGLERPRPFAQRLADTIRVDVFLLANTVPPEKSLDPGISNAELTAQLAYLTRLRDFADADAAAPLGRAYLKLVWDRPRVLNDFAATLLADAGTPQRDLELILSAARRASELTEMKDPAILDTLAQAHAARGEFDKALELARMAEASLSNAPPAVATEVKATRERLERRKGVESQGG